MSAKFSKKHEHCISNTKSIHQKSIPITDHKKKKIKMFVCMTKTCPFKGRLQDITAFRPCGREGRAKATKNFDETVQKSKMELNMDMLNMVRCKVCMTCRERVRVSQRNTNTAFGKCRFFYKKIKAEAVCELCSDIENIEFDHIDPATKSHDLGDYAWWPRHGGVEAMKAELSKCRPLCRKCHQYAKTSLKRKYEHIDDMPNVTKQDKQNKLFRQYRDEKAGYVLELKMRIGAANIATFLSHQKIVAGFILHIKMLLTNCGVLQI